MVQISPRVSLGLPSAMSSFLMLTSFTCRIRCLEPQVHNRSIRCQLRSEGDVDATLPVCVWGSPGRSGHSAACGSACVLSPLAAEENTPAFRRSSHSKHEKQSNIPEKSKAQWLWSGFTNTFYHERKDVFLASHGNTLQHDGETIQVKIWLL